MPPVLMTVLESLLIAAILLAVLFVVRRVAGDAAQDAETVKSSTPSFEFITHLYRLRKCSLRAFGPGERTTAALLDHIRKELKEIEAKPQDVTEWAGLLLLAFDGAMRRGFTPEQLSEAVSAKQAVNEKRIWPDWRTLEPGQAFEPVREQHIDQAWFRRQAEKYGERELGGLMACNPTYLMDHPLTLAQLAAPDATLVDALATEAVDMTDDLVVLAAGLRRLSESRTTLIRSQAAEIERLHAEQRVSGHSVTCSGPGL